MAEVETTPLPEANNYGVISEDEGPVIELGDRIRLSGGQYDGTKGRVVYRSQDEIHLMPDGLTHTVMKFTLNEDGFDDEYAIDGVEILQKRKKTAFIDILDLAPGQLLETFEQDGKPGPTYTIVKVDSDLDSIIVKNEDEGEVDISFGFKGVPDTLPFTVVRGRQAPEKPLATLEEDSVSENEDEGESEGAEDEEDEEEIEDFSFLDDELEAPAEEGVEYLIEIPSSERTYSNVRQKSEAYADLLSLYSAALQKLDSTQKNTRILTELFFQLRGSILRLSDDGTPKGIKPTSIQTLIDLLETRNMALSRTVVDVDKVIYHDKDPATDPDEPTTLEHLVVKYFKKKILDSDAYLTSSSDMEGQKYNAFLNSYLTKFAAPWRPASEPRIAFQRDEEVFRLKAPENETSIPGYSAGLAGKKEQLSAQLISEVSTSLFRGLKATRVKGKLQEIGEEASVLSYVVFPLVYAYALSTLREESIVRDVQYGMNEFRSIREVIKGTGGEISDIPSPSTPFLVSVEGGTLGNIPLREYLKATSMKAEGMGDVWPLQVLLGMREREWTVDQQSVLLEVIAKTQNAILDVVLRQRETLAKHASQPLAVQGIQMVPEGPSLILKLSDEPIIKDIQKAIKDQMPSFANSDVALVGLVLRQHSDLAFAQLADQPAALTRSRMRYAREEYLTTIRNIQLVKDRAAFAGEPPQPINCPHVKPLEMIRKVKDNHKRLSLMAKFLTTFQGSKLDNWVKCRVGDHNLLCVHELLQVYQFLRPGDTAALNKDIQLNFGGGQFQGHYICRNCGQPISELEYDTHLEFDDQGRPMMGRSELVDKDAVTREEIDQLIGPLGGMEAEEEIEFDNETKTIVYTTAKQMADKLNAPLESSDYMALVSRAFGIIQQIPTRERYIQIQQAQKKSKTAATAAAAAADYDVYINQALVCAVGVHLLILIQSKKPDITIRAMPTGCRSLRGQPLEPEGNHGIQCIVAVISSFNKDSPPWNLTQFQKEKEEGMRQKAITAIFEPILRSALQDPTILQGLAQKRDYRRKILGMTAGQGRPDEQLPEDFAPIPFLMKPEDFVEKVIVPEAASPRDRAELWIRQGNHIAKENKLPKPMVFSETSCCLSPIHNAGDFWNKSAASLPPFKKPTGLPAPPKITRSEPTMKPSLIFRPLPDAPESSYYLLFLKVCYDGEKKGQTHEFGLTHTCMWCGLKLPKDSAVLTPEQGRAAIEQQGIDISKESFDDLLNETHRVNTFKTNLLLELPGPLDTWVQLTEMTPEPALDYKIVMSRTQVALSKLAPDAKDVEVAVALSEFSTFVTEIESQFKTRISPAQHGLFDSLVNSGAESIMRFLQSYVIVPLKQFVSKQAPFMLVPKGWDLSFQHDIDIKSMLKEHRSYLTKFNKIQSSPWLNAKVETVLVQSRTVLNSLSSLRPLQIPGGLQTYKYFLKLCLYAPLATFVDPNILPIAGMNIEAPASQVEQQALFPARFISDMAARFKVEGLHLTPEQIREMIAERNEKEKANIIKKMSDMSRSGKEIEKMKIKFGIGEYSVGGTKAIYAYDQDRYDIEREQRAEAGIVDFPGRGPEGPHEYEGQGQMDGLGYYETGGNEEGYIGDDMLGDINGFDDDN